MDQVDNKLTIQAAFDRWAAGTGGVFDLLAPDASWTIVGNSVAAGTYSRDDFMKRVIEPFNARLSTPLVPHVRGLYNDGDMVVAFFDASATVRDGTPYSNTYTWYLRMSDDQVVEAFAFFDSVEFNDFWARVEPA